MKPKAEKGLTFHINLTCLR